MTYPDAIAKFKSIPQVFSLLFFFMLFVLGMGSNVGMANCVMTAIRDQFPRLKHWAVAIGIAVVGFCIGSVYTTPGGQYMLQFMDFYGASFIAFMLAIAELVTIAWIYGVDRLCKDIEFMLNIKTGYYFSKISKLMTCI
jgi:solute carrier family 6 (neurotransmitter transporter, glycine) member 5/9